MVKTADKTPLAQLLRLLIVMLLVVIAVEVAFLGILPGWSIGNERKKDMRLDVALKPINTLPPVDSFQEAVRRSLFGWNRQPVTPDDQLIDEEGLSSRWILSGVVNTGEAIYAIFVGGSGDQHLRLEEGMYLETWKIVSISPEAVTLNNDGEEEVFRLKEVDIAKPKEETPQAGKRGIRVKKQAK